MNFRWLRRWIWLEWYWTFSVVSVCGVSEAGARRTLCLSCRRRLEERRRRVWVRLCVWWFGERLLDGAEVR